MGVQHSIREGILTLELVGIYEPQDVVRAFLDGLNQPEGASLVGLLLDVTRSESLASRPAADIRNVAGMLGPYADRIGRRCAVVAAADVHFGLSRMGASHSERAGVTTEVFRTADEARKWLTTSDRTA